MHDRVKEFHERFGAPVGTEPNVLTPERRKARILFKFEELFELAEEAGFDVGIEIAPGAVGSITKDQIALIDTDREPNLVGMGDALGDIDYFTHGMGVEMGIRVENMTLCAHFGNMTKLAEDGTPIVNGITPGYRDTAGDMADGLEHHREDGYRPDQPIGKILKGPNYVAPTPLMERAIRYGFTELTDADIEEFIRQERNAD